MKKKIIPITLLTGYLGAGKTTLLNSVLKNQKGYKVAVIVNDIGEINIDATFIEKEGVVGGEEGSLVPLTNGCICCTLKTDLIRQIAKIYKMNRFDYILIEASGICEPIPIAQTITMLDGSLDDTRLPEICRLDSIVSVVDAKRMIDEFFGGEALLSAEIEEDDIENLLIQQIEFCNTIVLNKTDLITEDEKKKIIHVIKVLQPEAKIIETSYGQVNCSEIFDTYAFNFEKAGLSAGWVKALTEEEEEPETEEYGIGTFVFESVRPFSQKKFESYVNDTFPQNIIRMKGVLWFQELPDEAYIFEQSGHQMMATMSGKWIAATPKHEREQYLKDNTSHSWDKQYGDRFIKLVVIGKDMDKTKIKEELEGLLTD